MEVPCRRVGHRVLLSFSLSFDDGFPYARVTFHGAVSLCVLCQQRCGGVLGRREIIHTPRQHRCEKIPRVPNETRHDSAAVRVCVRGEGE